MSSYRTLTTVPDLTVQMRTQAHFKTLIDITPQFRFGDSLRIAQKCLVFLKMSVNHFPVT